MWSDTCPHCVVLHIEESSYLFFNTRGKTVPPLCFYQNNEMRHLCNDLNSVKSDIKLFTATFVCRLNALNEYGGHFGQFKIKSNEINTDHICALLISSVSNAKLITVIGFCLASVLIVNELGVCKQLFVQFAPTLRPNAALWQCACNHLSISHILSLHPCHGGKLTHFDTALFPDWSVIGTLHLLSAPNALWVFSRHDPIFPYFSPARGKLTNNTRISHCFYCCSS